MKLKDDEVLKAGDIIHYRDGETIEVCHLSGCRVGTIKKHFSDDTFAAKVTRNSPRVSRKEWKRRAIDAENRNKKALEYIELHSDVDAAWLDTGDTLWVTRILRGEN